MLVVFLYENDGVNALIIVTGAQAASMPSVTSATTESMSNLDLKVNAGIKETRFMQMVYAINTVLVCAKPLPARRGDRDVSCVRMSVDARLRLRFGDQLY